MRDKIWYDLINIKHEESYFKRYIAFQYEVRRWFKISTIILSAGGIFSAFQNLKIPTIISMTCIGIIQLLQSIETHLVISDETLDHFKSVRSQISKLFLEYDKLFTEINNNKISKDDMFIRMNELREIKLSIDDESEKKKLNIIWFLLRKSDKETKNYLKTYYNVEI